LCGELDDVARFVEHGRPISRVDFAHPLVRECLLLSRIGEGEAPPVEVLEGTAGLQYQYESARALLLANSVLTRADVVVVLGSAATRSDVSAVAEARSGSQLGYVVDRHRLWLTDGSTLSGRKLVVLALHAIGRALDGREPMDLSEIDLTE
jgi:hypothetical protein